MFELRSMSRWQRCFHETVHEFLVRSDARGFCIKALAGGWLFRNILSRLFLVYFGGRYSQTTRTFYGTRPRTRYWWRIVTVGDFSKICRYLVVRTFFPLLWRWIADGASSWWGFGASGKWFWCVRYFSRLICRFWRRSQLGFHGLECGGITRHRYLSLYKTSSEALPSNRPTVIVSFKSFPELDRKYSCL